MPFPNQTDRQAVIETAAQLIATEGVDQLTWGKLAKAVGVKPPSLYRHVKNRDEVLDLVVRATYIRLFERYAEALKLAPPSPIDQCLLVAQAHRRFALENPNLYTLSFSRAQPDHDPSELLLGEAIKLQKIVVSFAGEEQALTALRGLLAITHGFASLEINRQLRRGGDLNDAFSNAVRTYLTGWS